MQKISTKIIKENIPNWLAWDNIQDLEAHFDNEIAILCGKHNLFDELCSQFKYVNNFVKIIGAKSQNEIKTKAIEVWTNPNNWKRVEKIKLNDDEREYDYSCGDFGTISNSKLYDAYCGEDEVFVNSDCIKRTYINEKFVLGDWRLEILSSPNDELIAFSLVVD